jgi:hypothetical protein
MLMPSLRSKFAAWLHAAGLLRLHGDATGTGSERWPFNPMERVQPRSSFPLNGFAAKWTSFQDMRVARFPLCCAICANGWYRTSSY